MSAATALVLGTQLGCSGNQIPDNAICIEEGTRLERVYSTKNMRGFGVVEESHYEVTNYCKEWIYPNDQTESSETKEKWTSSGSLG